jgi:hypothetical protein
MPVLTLQVGARENECATVQVLNSTGDGWLRSHVSLKVGAFSAEYPCMLDGGAFQRFEHQLRELHRALKGKAEFSSYEGQFDLELTGDGMGHILVRGEAMDVAGIGNTLKFQLELDQTDLPAMLRQVAAIVATHPDRVG